MAKKGGAKGTAGYDYYTLSSEQKATVQALYEMYPEASKDHIAIVLQYYNFDQDKATDAFSMDGGIDALNNWNSTENSQTKVANKNKKKNKKKNRKDNGSIMGVAAVGTDGDAEDSSSLHSSNIDFDGEKEPSTKPDLDNETTEKGEDTQSMCNNVGGSSCERQAFTERDGNVPVERVETPEESKSDDGLLPSLDADSVENSVAESTERLSPKETNDEQSRHHSSKYAYNRQRHGSYRYSKSSSVSEDNASAMQTSNVQKHRSFVRSEKDLNRQSVSLQNILLKVENKLEEANKYMKSSFTEVRNMLDKRQTEMELQLETVKEEALALLTGRLNLAHDLKERMARASAAPDPEWLDLRADIKQFVTERKYDDELGKTIWFQWSIDSISEEMKKFGEVVPVKNSYSQRNSVSRNQSSPELSQHDLDLKTEDGLPEEGRDDESSVRDSGHDGVEAKVEKEPIKMGQGENRSRIFSNQRYLRHNNYRGFPRNHNNQSRGFYRARGNSGGYRGNRYENHQYRQYGGGDRYEHRQHQQQYSQEKPDYHHGVEERAPEAHVPLNNDSNNPSAAYSSNPRDQQPYRYPRNQNRRPYGNRYPAQRAFNHHGPNRIVHKPPRANSETMNTGDNVGNNDNYDQASQEKPDVLNGY